MHLDVIDSAEIPQVDQQGLASFAVPALCVLRPQEVDSASELMTDVMQSLGINLGGRRNIGARGGGRNVNLGRGSVGKGDILEDNEDISLSRGRINKFPKTRLEKQPQGRYQ